MTEPRRWLCILALAAVSLAGCHDSEEARWQACCAMRIVDGQKTNSASAGTIIKLLPRGGFDAATGQSLARVEDTPIGIGSTKKTILVAMNLFLASHPKDRPSDYFLGLGMTCKPVTPTTPDRMHCEIELPIQVECLSRGKMAPPLPEELQKLLPARLFWQVDVSQSALLRTNARVEPVPGGRLCHR